MDSKPTNPKDAIGSDKLPIHLWPPIATVLGCLGLLDGALKYGRANWRAAGVRTSIYYDAMRRHLDALLEGVAIDPDSGLPQEAHILACCAIIVDARERGLLTDDYNYGDPGVYRSFIAKMTPHVARLKAMYADRHPKHWTAADNTSEKNVISSEEAAANSLGVLVLPLLDRMEEEPALLNPRLEMTAAEWISVYENESGIKVEDADGFRDLHPMAKIRYREFVNRLGRCTVTLPH